MFQTIPMPQCSSWQLYQAAGKNNSALVHHGPGGFRSALVLEYLSCTYNRARQLELHWQPHCFSLVLLTSCGTSTASSQRGTELGPGSWKLPPCCCFSLALVSPPLNCGIGISERCSAWVQLSTAGSCAHATAGGEGEQGEVVAVWVQFPAAQCQCSSFLCSLVQAQAQTKPSVSIGHMLPL